MTATTARHPGNGMAQAAGALTAGTPTVFDDSDNIVSFGSDDVRIAGSRGFSAPACHHNQPISTDDSEQYSADQKQYARQLRSGIQLVCQ